MPYKAQNGNKDINFNHGQAKNLKAVLPFGTGTRFMVNNCMAYR